MPHTILTIKNALLSIDGVEYADAITSCTVAVSYASNSFIPISGQVQTSVGALEHVLNLDFGQSMKNGELMHKLYTLHGQEKPFSLRPVGGTTPSVSGTLVVTAPTSIGGGVGTATSTAALPIKGTPTIAWAPAV